MIDTALAAALAGLACAGVTLTATILLVRLLTGKLD